MLGMWRVSTGVAGRVAEHRILRHFVVGESIGRDLVQGIQSAKASQRLGLSVAGAEDRLPKFQSQSFIPWNRPHLAPDLTWRVDSFLWPITEVLADDAQRFGSSLGSWTVGRRTEQKPGTGPAMLVTGQIAHCEAGRPDPRHCGPPRPRLRCSMNGSITIEGGFLDRL